MVSEESVVTTVQSKTAAPVETDPISIEALVLSCIDYRLVEPVARYLTERGLRNRYDQIMLAGAAIGVLNDQHDAWGKTFWEHVALARELHSINRVIVIDHRDCAACKVFIGNDCAANRDSELVVHQQWMCKLAKNIHEREPGLIVELLLMGLDGSVEDVGSRL